MAKPPITQRVSMTRQTQRSRLDEERKSALSDSQSASVHVIAKPRLFPRPQTHSGAERRLFSTAETDFASARKPSSASYKSSLGFRFDLRISALASVSVTGQIGDQPKTDNQDAFIAIKSFGGSDRAHLFAIFDGHGEDGHVLTTYLKDAVPRLFAPSVKAVLDGNMSMGCFQDWLQTAFPCIHSQLCRDLPLDSDMSGSTAVVVVVIDDTLLCANVGDSRAVLGCKGSPWRLIPLTHDHRPDSPGEKERICKKGGRVQANEEEPGAPRVWLPGRNVPGLAMSRSLGDALVHQYGVTPDPEISIRKLKPWDRVLILASDGIWSYMSSEEAIQIAGRYYEKRRATDTCDHLLREACTRWKTNNSRVDDITVVTVFLN